MTKSKCFSCGHEFEAIKQNKKIKVTLSNPGDVFCEGEIVSCPNCSAHYAEGEDILKIAESFDKAHAEKYDKFKKKDCSLKTDYSLKWCSRNKALKKL